MTFSPHEIELVIGALLTALGSGGLLGAWFTHTRELPQIRAKTLNMDWERFQNEIARLDDKIISQETRIAELEREVATCHISKEQQSLVIAKQNFTIAELELRLTKQELSNDC